MRPAAQMSGSAAWVVIKVCGVMYGVERACGVVYGVMSAWRGVWCDKCCVMRMWCDRGDEGWWCDDRCDKDVELHVLTKLMRVPSLKIDKENDYS